MASKYKASTLKIVIIGVILITGLAWGGMTLYSAFSTKSAASYAEEVAKPLEAALVKAGGVKKCSSGDNGRGWDNDSPHYGSTFELQASKNDAISMMQEVAAKAGYHLIHASPENRGPLGAVADSYIDKWYFDESSKQSPFNDLESGRIELHFVVYDAGEKNDCTQKIIESGRSAIGLGVSLPSFKH